MVRTRTETLKVVTVTLPPSPEDVKELYDLLYRNPGTKCNYNLVSVRKVGKGCQQAEYTFKLQK